MLQYFRFLFVLLHLVRMFLPETTLWIYSFFRAADTVSLALAELIMDGIKCPTTLNNDPAPAQLLRPASCFGGFHSQQYQWPAPYGMKVRGRRGLVVKAAGWLSLDRQFEPYLRAQRFRPRGVAWDAVPEP
jgi:hypothetical protein